MSEVPSATRRLWSGRCGAVGRGAVGGNLTFRLAGASSFRGTRDGRKRMMATTDEARAPAHTVLATRLGNVTVVREDGALSGLYFPRHWPRPDRTAFGARTDEGFEDVARQLGEYLAGERSAFELPVNVKGAEFDLRVWELIAGVPYGATTTYGELARRLGAGTDPRDVGAA